jgi:hypothetical protein
VSTRDSDPFEAFDESLDELLAGIDGEASLFMALDEEARDRLGVDDAMERRVLELCRFFFEVGRFTLLEWEPVEASFRRVGAERRRQWLLAELLREGDEDGDPLA